MKCNKTVKRNLSKLESKNVGITEYFGFLLIPIWFAGAFLSVKAAKEFQKRKIEERRYLFNFNFISFGIFAQLLPCEECIPGPFESCRFSQIRRWSILVVSGS